MAKPIDILNEAAFRLTRVPMLPGSAPRLPRTATSLQRIRFFPELDLPVRSASFPPDLPVCQSLAW